MPNSEGLMRACRCEPAGCVVLAAALALCLARPALSGAAETRGPAWKTGAQFERQLEAEVGVTWASPLRQCLGNLARTQGVAVFLDRRVDPDQEVRFSMQDVALRSLLRQLAEQLGLGTCRVGPVVYLGPPATSAVLSTVCAQAQDRLQQLPAALRTRLTRPQPWRWPELAAPRTLLVEVLAELDLRVEHAEAIPHDLWPAAELPPLDVAQRLSLLLAGFGLTFELADARTVRLLPLPETAVLERTYSVPSDRAAALQELTRRFPDSRVSRRGDGVLVAGSWEAHEALQAWLHGRSASPSSPAKPAAKAEVRWSLKIENEPVGAVVQTVAKRLEQQLEYDPGLRGKLEQLVSFEVREVSLDQLLQAALTPAGLTYRLEQRTLRILPAEPPRP